MIQVYHASESDFSVNGIEVNPTDCEFEATINGTWSLNMTVPYSDERWKDIEDNGVVKCMTPYGKQLFRIYSRDKSKFDIQVTAYPIFLDAKNDTFIYDTRPTNCDGQTALNTLLQGTKYKGHSNIGTKSTAYWQRKNVIECIGSDEDNSFLNRWGGEVKYDNYDIYVNTRIGEDNGMRVEFGFNMNEIEEKIDFSDVVTRIRPVSYNGYQLVEGEFVDSQLRSKYPKDFVKEIEYSYIKLSQDLSGEASEGDIVCDSLDSLREALRKEAQKEYDENQLDRPSIEYTVSVVDLSRSDRYELFKSMLKLNLGDTVVVKNKRLDIDTTARVKSIKYDCITQRMTELTIGDVVPTFFDKQADIQRSLEQTINISDSSVRAETIKGIVNMMNTQMRAQKNNSQRSDTRAILFEDTDPSSDMFGALSIGTQGIQISHTRNSSNSDWVWGTAINYNSIIADYILTGILSDKTGNFHLNMDTGELVMNDGTFKGTLNTKKDVNIGAELCFLAKADSLSPGTVWSDVRAKKEDGTLIPARLMLRNIPYDNGVSSLISMISNSARVTVESNQNSEGSETSSDVNLTANSNNYIRISSNAATNDIVLNGKHGLTGTYTVTKSITVQNGLVTGVE